jgi:LysM repeat protein
MTSLGKFRLAATIAASVALAACSTAPKPGVSGTQSVSTAHSEIEAIAQLLDRGEIKPASKRLTAALKRDPLNPSLLVLQQGLVGDAQTDLGPSNYPYMVAPGDKMADLAERFLGNRLKSYQLARYNGLANPAKLVPGQVIRIPGQPAQAVRERSAQPPAPQRKKGAVASTSAPARPTAPPAPAARAVDKAGAQRARAAGLAALNQGNVAQAVSQLQRAASLDPGNATIAKDLARARRISATVKSKR